MKKYDYLPRNLLSRLLDAINTRQNLLQQKMKFSEKSYFLHGKFNPFILKKQDDRLPPSLDWLFNSICNTLNMSKQIVKDEAWSLNYHHVKSLLLIFLLLLRTGCR